MFATKGRLKVSLLVVGVLIVGLGMYAGFQVQDADAHGTHVRQGGAIKYRIETSTVWTFSHYTDPCTDGYSVKIEEKWEIKTRYKLVYGYLYHADGSYHNKLISKRAVSRSTTRTGRIRYVCSRHGTSCPDGGG